jgi:hypothetical protein
MLGYVETDVIGLSIEVTFGMTFCMTLRGRISQTLVVWCYVPRGRPRHAVYSLKRSQLVQHVMACAGKVSDG